MAAFNSPFDQYRAFFLRGMAPNPWAWDDFRRANDIRAFEEYNPSTPNVPIGLPAGVNPFQLAQMGISSAQKLGGLLPPGTLNNLPGMGVLDDTINAVKNFVSPAFEPVSNAASGAIQTVGDTVGVPASALSSGLSAGVGAAGSLAGPLLSAALNKGRVNPESIAYAIPGALKSGGAALAALGSNVGTTAGATAAGAMGGAGALSGGFGASGTSTLAGLGAGLGSLGSLFAVPAAVIGIGRAVTDYVHGREKARRKAANFKMLQNRFQSGWPELTGTSNVLEDYNRLPLLSGEERNNAITTGLQKSRDALGYLPNIESYLGELRDRKGGEQLTKPYYDALPTLRAQGWVGQLRGIDEASKAGLPYGEMPSLQDVLTAMNGISGSSNFFPQGVPDRNRATPYASGGGESNDTPESPEWSFYQANPNPMTLANVSGDLQSAYKPGQTLDTVTNIFKQFSPDFSNSDLGRVLGGFGSTDPGRLQPPTSTASSGTETGGTNITRRGVGADQRPVSAIADMTQSFGPQDMDNVLNQSKAFLGSA